MDDENRTVQVLTIQPEFEDKHSRCETMKASEKKREKQKKNNFINERNIKIQTISLNFMRKMVIFLGNSRKKMENFA